MSADRREAPRQRAVRYLYGGMTAAEREGFERAAADDPALGALLEEERALDGVLPRGAAPLIDGERIRDNRRRLARRLRRRGPLGRPLGPLGAVLQGAALAAAFALGVMVAAPGGPGGAPAAAPPLALVGADDYEIHELGVDRFDAATGEVELSFALAARTRLAGNVADRDIRRLLAAALRDDIDSAARLETLGVLRPAADADAAVRDALIHVLANDPNPGVRYQAVRSLAVLADRESARGALRRALREDANPGVRVEAFDALGGRLDEPTLTLFRERMEADGNEYIRTRARSIVEERADAGPVM